MDGLVLHECDKSFFGKYICLLLKVQCRTVGAQHEKGFQFVLFGSSTLPL